MSGIYIFNLIKGSIEFINTQYTKITGYQLSDIESITVENFLELFHVDDRTKVFLHIEAMSNKEDDGYVEIEYRFKSNNGDWIWCLSRDAVFERDSQGCAVRMIGTFMETTERKALERKLQENEKRLRNVVENMPVMLNAVDDKGNILMWNKECERVTGYRSEEIISNPKIWEACYPNEKYRRDLLNDGQQEVESNNRECKFQAKDGVDHYISWLNVSKILPIPGWHSWAVGQDVSEQYLIQEKLNKTLNNFNQTLENIDSALILLNIKGNLISANRAFYDMIGSESGSGIGHHILELLHPCCQREGCPVAQAIEAPYDDIIIMEMDNIHNPMSAPAEFKIKVIKENNLLPSGILMSIHDLTYSRKIEDEQQVAASVFNNTLNSILIADSKGVIQQVNKSFTEITGFTSEEAIGNTPRLFKSEHHSESFYSALWDDVIKHGKWEGEIWNRRKNGEVFTAWQSITAVKNNKDEIKHYIGVMSDITEQKLSAERISYLAQYDVVTELPNRSLLEDRIQQLIKHARREDLQLAILFIDLDRFKRVNDSLGHPFGDKILKHVSSLLLSCIREQDTVGRLSGDEFIILVEVADSFLGAELVAKKVLKAFNKPLTLEGHTVQVGTSIGISLFPNDGDTFSELIQRADFAMYQAKKMGGSQYHFFEKKLSDSISKRHLIEVELREAIESGQLRTFFQPQFDLKSGCLSGSEALIRWLHPVRGLIGPAEFLSVAEETGLIVQIGEWILNDACKFYKSWIDKKLTPGVLAVNLDGQQIQQDGLVDLVNDIIISSGLPVSNLELEITEGYIMKEVERDLNVLNELRSLGVSIAIDDFGTGQSSLSYLKHLPINKLKIDRSFIMDIPQDSNDQAITQAIIAMGKSLGLKLIAEGVETEQQEDFLMNCGCYNVQGFRYSKPLAAEEFENLLVSITLK
ncbi:MAG: EAL domain-containing protein [Gammaproteobacteria bacterium]|nr:EAL domain-containing protein [Gammaproteobacteria bacterium]